MRMSDLSPKEQKEFEEFRAEKRRAREEQEEFEQFRADKRRAREAVCSKYTAHSDSLVSDCLQAAAIAPPADM